ncbi:hypothetical protein D3C78_1557050 [compost metagenome]
MDDAFTGVVPFYAPDPILPLDTNSTDDQEQQEETEPEIAGFIVGVPVPQGLFHPRFNLLTWEAGEEGDTSDQSSYWVERLTPEEIDELTSTPIALTDTFKQQLLAAEEETTNTQIALTVVYEQLLAFKEELASIKGGAE